MTRCVAGAERKDEIPVETGMIRVALQLTSKRNIIIEMKASTRQQFKLNETGIWKRHGRQMHLCLNSLAFLTIVLEKKAAYTRFV